MKSQKGFFVSILSFVLFLFVLMVTYTSGQMNVAAQGPPDSMSGNFVTGQILVKFQPGVNRAEQAKTHSNFGSTVKKEIPQIGVHVVGVIPGMEKQMVKAYSNNPNVLFAEVDYLHQLHNPNDGGFYKKWDLHNDASLQICDGGNCDNATFDADIDWLEAYDYILSGISDNNIALSDVVIAMVDTGADLGHPDLNIWVNTGDMDNNGVDDDGNGFTDDVNGWDFQDNDKDPTDEDGHGTHTGGLAGAIADNGGAQEDTAGVSFRNTALMILRVCGDNGCAVSNLISAYTYAADNGADVMNISIGGSFRSRSEDQAIKYAWQRDVVITASAGNNGGSLNGSTWKNYPAAYNNVMAISSTDWHDDLAYYSSHGNWLSVAAPGGELFCGGNNCSDIIKGAGSYSTTPTYQPAGQDSTYKAFGWSSNIPYDYAHGTSMSSPVVAGLAALIRAINSGLTNSEVRSIIETTADDLGSAGFDDVYGNGRINALAAVQAADPGSLPTNNLPIANFDFTTNSLNAYFTDTSTDSDGSVEAWSWNFGDGSTSTIQSPSRTYTANGTYTVTLTVTDNDGATDSTSQYVTVSDGSGGCSDDADGDGYVSVECGGDDCDDTNKHVHPDHNDTKGRWGKDGVDNDCNGIIDG